MNPWPLDFVVWDGTVIRHNESKIKFSSNTSLIKAFSDSQTSTDIIPYYYRALHEHEQGDITVTTIVTSNRFEALKRLSEYYQGPVSVTIHVTSTPYSHRTDLLKSLHALYTSSPFFSRWVDVHLVVDAYDRRFNMWRNLARLYARTAWVMMLDIDFMICTDVRERLKRALSEGGTSNFGMLARNERAAFVVPAFEYIVQEEGRNWRTFPRDKKRLLELVNAGKLDMFHQSWAPGHNCTSYSQYYVAKPGEVYRVDAYQKSYEPYVIMQREGPPWCDERFVGYGGNKAACLFAIYVAGIDFYVLPDDFLIHQSHAYAEEARKNERKHNQQVYNDFRKELCLEQIAAYMRSGTLYTDSKSNLRSECMKIPGIPEVVLQSLELKMNLSNTID